MGEVCVGGVVGLEREREGVRGGGRWQGAEEEPGSRPKHIFTVRLKSGKNEVGNYDRFMFDNRWLLFWYYGLRGLSLLYLPFTDFSFYGLSLFALFYGLDWLATVPPTVKITAARFGRERANLVFGWVFAGHQLGAAAAAFGAGLSRTALESYLPAFFAAGGLCLIAAALALTLGGGERRAAPNLASLSGASP